MGISYHQTPRWECTAIYASIPKNLDAKAQTCISTLPMKITNSCKCSPMLKSHSFFQSFLRQIIIINQQHYILYQTTQIRNDKQRESTIKYQIHRGFILTAWSNNPIDQADEPLKKKKGVLGDWKRIEKDGYHMMAHKPFPVTVCHRLGWCIVTPLYVVLCPWPPPPISPRQSNPSVCPWRKSSFAKLWPMRTEKC